ncbi:hypothetical protein WJX72_003114 [[Myrmecia] bisecta]|uniref:Uncharacterized protein n=1 Tax=[Myrmecia] bisecta TaxID=41462 RepID=A0AAW1QEL1_9CHLO
MPVVPPKRLARTPSGSVIRPAPSLEGSFQEPPPTQRQLALVAQRAEGRDPLQSLALPLSEETWRALARQYSMDLAWKPQVELLVELGCTLRDLRKLLQRPDSAQPNQAPRFFTSMGDSLRLKLGFFTEEVGMSREQVRRMLVKYPRIMEYSVLHVLWPHLQFFLDAGVPKNDMPKVVVRAPMVMQMSIANTLEPRIYYLTDRVGISEELIGKVIARLPQILSYSEDAMHERVEFLLENGLSQADIARAVASHPQLLHYRTESMQRRLAWLRQIGLTPEQVCRVVSQHPQLVCRDIERQLQPKFAYLCKELGGSADSIASFPNYLSLSLAQRIIPRHRYLETVRGRAITKFPLNHLKCSNAIFAEKVAGTNLMHFEAFRLQMAMGGSLGVR